MTNKRLILIADDELTNREILAYVLKDSYDLIFAEDGQQALEAAKQYGSGLSLIILDLQMPKLHGLEVLGILKKDPELKEIPVIVMTADQSAEVESLRLGAIDFIPKPYPQPEVIQARVRRTIELSEDKKTIQYTERDSLTGLYNRDFFFRYAEQMDLRSGTEMDAIVININHFRMINERYGKAQGDRVLKAVAEKISKEANRRGGLAGRREADAFLIYMPHTEDHRAFLASVSDGLSGQEALQGGRVRLRMGVYANASKDLDMERRFDRAKMAANTLRNSYDQSVAHYDNQLRESELYAEQLLEDFRQALDERQFTVYYQPKFDIRPEIPVLTSAEALVRWNHPRLGFISPGVFIPLFEENGLVQQLDNYVWNRAAEQIRDWKERYGITIPVSVNVSRVDMYDPGLLSGFKDLIERNGIDSKDLYLEITESAYTQDSGQIIDTVNKLRELGFKVEMDDFGTGYSSLNMISTLPIDALKLDMKFIRSAFSGRKDTRMLEVILDIADYLSVPVVAEGVETEEQLLALRAMGCDIVQGYYFSKPVPPVEYEEFIKKRLSQGASDDLLSSAVKHRRERTNVSYMRIARALSSGYESIYYVDMANAHYVEFSARGNYEDLQIQESGVDFFADTSANIPRVVYAEDQNRLLNIMKKEELKARLDQEESVSCTYRLVIKDRPVYYNMKVVYASGTDHQHIVIGVSNVEAVIEQGLACGAAGASDTRDALTGVKNRWAFEKAEDEISARMASGEAGEFALVICDINELKTVNDTRGHKAGDRYIQEASRIICNTFKHSPVYRIGGDEFAVLLRGQDYSVRTDLLAELEKNNSGPYPELDHILAYGMAEYAPGSDSSADDIFERADAQMYNYKRLNKR